MIPAGFDARALFDLGGRIALVVGGASGIGQAAAIGFAQFGAAVAVGDVDLAGAQATADRIRAEGGTAEALAVDLRSTESVERAVAGVVARHGRIDVLLATPAINIRKRLIAYSDEEFDRLVELNVKGTFRTARAVGRQMAAQQSGSIILMSSIRAYNVEAGQTAYAATKAAIDQMAKGLAADLAEYGVRVNALAPSIVKTPLNKPIRDNPEWNAAFAGRTALGRWAETTEMAGPAIFLASQASSYITATTLMVDAGWSAVDGRFKPPV
ncbi:MAG: SDR family NAD(P)-dependent oxidoreductase [Reyranellaceae bacterium]